LGIYGEKENNFMKHLLFYRPILFLILFVCLPVFLGCSAHEPAQIETQQTDRIDVQNSEVTEDSRRQAPKKWSPPKPIANSNEFELVETPFGVVKRRVTPRSQKRPMTEKSSQVTQANENIKHRNSTTASEEPIVVEPPKDEKRGTIVFNFDDADLYEVIRTMADLLDFNYIIDEKVKGMVTIHTAGRLKQSDLLPTFYQILEANNLTAVQEGALLRISPTQNAARLSLPTRIGRNIDDIPPGQRIIIQIIPLNYIAAAEMTKLLQPFISSAGSIISHQESNTMLLVDKGVNIVKALRLVEVFDVNVFDKAQHRFFTLTNIDAAECVNVLSNILEGYNVLGKNGIQLMAMEKLNMILAISANPAMLDKVAPLVQQVDLPSEEVEPRIYVYSVKNGEAQELTGLLNQVFGTSPASTTKEKTKTDATDKTLGTKGKQDNSSNPFLKITPPKDNSKTTVTTASSKQTSGSGTLRHEVKIIADEIRNSLIIEAIPSDYRIVESILKELDVLPRQVLIEVKIADFKLEDKFELGMVWNAQDPVGANSQNETWGSIAGDALGNGNVYAGLQYFIGESEKWNAALSTLATKNKVNIISTPTLLASDNKEAKINVSQEIPVASTLYETTGNSDPLLRTNIQYRNTGVILSVTPHINERGLVSMDIDQEVSQASDPVAVGNEQLPSFFKRSVSTSLTVQHGQTIVIGGLISESSTKGGTGVPYLRDIPFLGYLFGKETDSKDKTEMIILITPRVIASLEDVDLVTEEFQNKVSKVSSTVEF